MLYKIRCNTVHPLYGALPGPYVPVRVTRCALVAHRYTYAPSRCGTSQYRRTFIPLWVSLWNNLANPLYDGVGLAGFKSRANDFLLALTVLPLLWSSIVFFLSLLSVYSWHCGSAVLGLIECISLSLSLALPTFFNNNNNNNNNNITMDYARACDVTKDDTRLVKSGVLWPQHVMSWGMVPVLVIPRVMMSVLVMSRGM